MHKVTLARCFVNLHSAVTRTHTKLLAAVSDRNVSNALAKVVGRAVAPRAGRGPENSYHVRLLERVCALLHLTPNIINAFAEECFPAPSPPGSALWVSDVQRQTAVAVDASPLIGKGGCSGELFLINLWVVSSVHSLMFCLLLLLKT